MILSCFSSAFAAFYQTSIMTSFDAAMVSNVIRISRDVYNDCHTFTVTSLLVVGGRRIIMAGSGAKLHTKGRYYCGRNASVEGDVFLFKGAGGSVGVVKILEPLSPIFNYYEYEIVCRGQRCAIGIGVGEQGYPTDRMPGWNRNGIGYHADDGRLFHQDGYGRVFGPTCTEGDRMGCGVEFEASEPYVQVFFTKNGTQVGECVRMKRPVYGLYPLVGLHSRGESVRYLGHWQRTSGTVQEPMELDSSPAGLWLRSNGISFHDDALTLEYAGEGLDRQDVGIAQSQLRLDNTNHYFELEIQDSGKEGWIAIGVAKTTYPLHRHPGWNKGSIGYHADNGFLYKEKGNGEPFGPTCSEGDTMGCGIAFRRGSEPTAAADTESDDSDFEHSPELADFYAYSESDDDEDYYDDHDALYERLYARANHRQQPPPPASPNKAHPDSKEKLCTVYFTKNGQKVGEVECMEPSGGFYPVVAMLSPREKIRVNFNPLTG